GRPVVFVDRMNRTLLEKSVKGRKLEVVSGPGSAAAAFVGYVKGMKAFRIGFDPESLTVGSFGRLSAALGKSKLVSAEGLATPRVITAARSIKSLEEIRIMRRVARETTAIWSEAERKISPGMTEIEIAEVVDLLVRRKGYENSFPTIAAAGKNTAYPHAVPTSKKFASGEHVLVDFGIRHKGYCSDLTRVYYKGRINRQIEDFLGYVRQAQKAAIKQIRPGASIGSTVGCAFKVFNESELQDFNIHALGHGVGLEVHESPYLRDGSPETFKKGMVVTVEPGLYKPGLGGIRIEDMVLVTEKGCEVLTR
ncbi:MAG: Xaa-Pro peptidase family protein, partial [Candidatus Tantalella remota]|nr:Xaa-Pro peptidase family protein [Candidatus Tantalella remota]